MSGIKSQIALLIYLFCFISPVFLYAQSEEKALPDVVTESMTEGRLPEAIAENEHDEGGGGVFSGTLADSVWTIVWFVILLLVLMKFAWKPILMGLQSREEHIEKEVKDAEDIRKKAEDVLTDYRKKLANADQEGQKIIDSRMNQAKRDAEQLTKDTQKELENMRIRAQSEIERAQEQARAELQVEAGRMVVRLGEEILGRTITADDEQKMINEAINKLGEK